MSAMKAPTPNRRTRTYVVYAMVIVSQECEANDEKQAVEVGCRAIMAKFEGLDNNVHIPKVTVLEKGVDEETKRNLEEGVVPWLKNKKDKDESKPN